MPFTEFKGLKLPAHQISTPFPLFSTSLPMTSVPALGERQDSQMQQQFPTQKPVEQKLKSALLNGEKKRTKPKNVHWDPEIVDNEDKRQPWAKAGETRSRFNASMNIVHPSKISSMSTIRPSESSSSLRSSSSTDTISSSKSSSSLRPSPAVTENLANVSLKRNHSPHRRLQSANTGARRKALPPQTSHETAPRQPPHARSTYAGHHESRDEPCIPPAVPDAPRREGRTPSPLPRRRHSRKTHRRGGEIRTPSPSPRGRRLQKPDPSEGESQRPPPTPRPQRLPSPDLPAIGCGIFCECCKNQAPYLAPFQSPTERGYHDIALKYETQRVYQECNSRNHC